MKNTVLSATMLALSLGLSGGAALFPNPTVAQQWQGGCPYCPYGQQGMMGPGMSGQGWGGQQGMMGPGMGGQGWGGQQGTMGPGWRGQQGMMGPGMMGPGWGGQQGMMGPGMRMPYGRIERPLDLSTEQVHTMLERYLKQQGNPRLKVGEVKQKDEDTITAEIVTADGSLVQRFEIDRHTGWMEQAP